MKQGFTLIEVIIAVAVIITALVASISLISFTVSGTMSSKSKLIAANLAQEGLEITRNIRDNNWFAGKTGPDDGQPDWREGLGEGEHRVQYNTLDFLSPGSQVLKINSNGFYQYDTGTDTSFSRKVTIQYVLGDDDQIIVTCEVNWLEKARNRSIQIETRLYNWYSATP